MANKVDPDRKAGGEAAMVLPAAACPFCKNTEGYCTTGTAQTVDRWFRIRCSGPACRAEGPLAWESEGDPVRMAYRLWAGEPRTRAEINHLYRKR